MKALKPFDQYVSEARREPLLLKMPEGDPITVHFPTKNVLDRFSAAEATQNMDEMVLAFFGDTDGKRLLELLADAPADTVANICRDAMSEFGLDVPNSSGSSS